MCVCVKGREWCERQRAQNAAHAQYITSRSNVTQYNVTHVANEDARSITPHSPQTLQQKRNLQSVTFSFNTNFRSHTFPACVRQQPRAHTPHPPVTVWPSGSQHVGLKAGAAAPVPAVLLGWPHLAVLLLLLLWSLQHQRCHQSWPAAGLQPSTASWDDPGGPAAAGGTAWLEAWSHLHTYETQTRNNAKHSSECAGTTHDAPRTTYTQKTF